MNILLVEDDTVIADAICTYLGTQSMQVAHAPTIGAAKTYLKNNNFDACILDISLPDGNGLTLLQFVRKNISPLPVLVLTAKGSVDDKVKGLSSGADDYLSKPFDFRELVARLHSLHRRITNQAASRLVHGQLEHDLISQITYLSGTRIVLSKSETRLLLAFLNRPNQIISDTQLKDVLFGFNEDVASNALNVHLYNLRKKLGSNYIITERGLGYRLASVSELEK